jgi:PhzF family phenazine biosynthesis protein
LKIDAFTDQTFDGNQVCIFPFEEWLSDEILLKTANENAVAERVFLVDKGEKIHLRWFTPEINRQLYDHITLDSGGVIVAVKSDNCNLVSRFFTSQASF